MHDTSRQGVAIGFFDGVHIGHREILRGARTALTFRTHPLATLAPERAPRLIMPFAKREAAIRACGVEEVVALDFTPSFAALSPEEFARRFLRERIVRCGANWRFGKAGAGDAALLSRLGYDVRVSPYALFAGERVSSTRIRAAIECGDLPSANAMLSRAWSVEGRVVRGKGLGGKIGAPTVNLELDGLELRLPRGVYAVVAGGARGVANWGVAPTMREAAWTHETLEINFIDPPPAPSPVLGTAFLRFMRPERVFDSIEELARQIRLDREAVSLLHDQ